MSTARRLSAIVIPMLALALAGMNAAAACDVGVEILITEFMALNLDTVTDEDSSFEDWIEIYNPCLPSVDVGGWYLTDDPADLTRWQFPSVSLGRGEFLLVFASGKDRAVAGSELHANFKLSSEGEYLALVKPDGTTIAQEFAPAYPPQLADVSYGLPQAPVDFVSVGDTASYYVPTLADSGIGTAWTALAWDDSTWATGPTGLGYTTSGSGGFDVTYYKASITVDSLSAAEAVISDPGNQVSQASEMVQVINYLNTGGNGHFDNDRPYPSITLDQDVDDFAVLVTGTVLIPTAGDWTFGVSSDDGFGLDLTLDPHVFHSSFPEVRGVDDTLAVFNVTEPGVYALRLVTFERWAGAEVELFAAEGNHSSFNDDFKLVGDTANGGLGIGIFGAQIGTDVQSVMQNVNTSLWSRLEFSVTDPTLYDLLTLRLAYEDGIVAHLNGTEVASRNAPSPVDWDSASLVDRPVENAGAFETIDLTDDLHLLVPGPNVLAVHGLNDVASDGDFLALAELSGAGDTVDTGSAHFFPDATPGSYNSAGFPGVSGIPFFSHPSGSFLDPFSLSVFAVAPGAVIRYTTDGSQPTETSGLDYDVPLTIDNSVRIRARVLESGLAPGPVHTRLFTMLDADVIDFDSNLPIVVANTFGLGISANFFTENLISVIPKVADRVSITDPAQFEGLAGFKIRGTTSAGFPKKQYAVETWDPNFQDVDVALLDMPAESDWILNGPYSDKSLMRNVLAYQWSNDIGRYATRTQFVEMYLQTGSGPVNSSDYVGVYALFEKIKRNANRVPITQLEPYDNAEPEITGGYILKKDRLDPGDSGFLTSTGQRLEYVDPKESEISTAQAAWIQGYIYDFEQALYGPDFADPVIGYAKYIDVPAFIDHHILVEGTKNVDGFRHSTYMFKERGEKLHMGPIWDYNHCLGNANVREGWLPEGWYYDTLINHIEYPWYLRLFEDDAFVMAYADRWYELRRNEFRTEKMLADIDGYATLLGESQARNFVRWPILGIYVWPNWFIADTHQEEVDWIKWFLGTRLEWIDGQFFAPPVFNPPAGEVPAGSSLTITSSVGVVYYTLDGTDPRLSDGLIAPTAQAYVAPLPSTSSMWVKARALDGSTWSAINDGFFYPLPLAFINEALPDNQTVHADEQSEFDPWIELYNPFSTTVDLGGLFLTDDQGVPDKWPIPAGTTLCPSRWLLIWADGETGEGPLHANFTLSPAGGTIWLYDGSGYLMDALTYPALGPDESYGRRPDGGSVLSPFTYATPRTANPGVETPILLNEYNAVAPGSFLDNNGSDVFWGQVPGNGGNWFELVVVEDALDLRGWTVTVEDNAGAVSTTLTFTSDAILSDLRSGTIITVGTGLASNVSYDPANGDWWIHLRAGVAGDGLYVSALDFSVSNQDSWITLSDDSATVVFGPAGEGINPPTGIGSDEVFKLEEDPGPLVTAYSAYGGGSTSTFGAPNQWDSGAGEQSFVVLRSVVAANCTLNSQCNDGNLCTDDGCNAGTCENLANAVICDDGNSCTQNDACSAGQCRGQIVEDCCVLDCECDDGDACTTDQCIATVCVNDLAPTGTPCDDENLCTVDATCDQGLCLAGAPVDCSTVDDDCNLGVCNPIDSSCEAQTTNEGGACDDGDACYSAKTCVLGFCEGGVVIDCSGLDDVCNVGVCAPGVGCEAQPANESGACDDGVSCTTGETCGSGDCSGGASNCPAGETCNAVTDECEAISNYLPILLGDEWGYIVNTAGEPDPDWRDIGFDDSSWASAPGGLCYGPDCPAECNTALSAMQDNSVTTYYRRGFYIANPAAVQSLTLTITYDDGFVAFINGVEAARSNVWGDCSLTMTTLCQSDGDCPGGESCLIPTYDRQAGNPEGHTLENHECTTGGSGGPGGDEVFDISAAISNLVTGSNVIAIQGHNLTVDSTDFVQSPKLSSVENPIDCTSDPECDDGNACSTDVCLGGFCDHIPSGVCSLSGSVSYYRDSGSGSEPSAKPVPDVQIDIDGDAVPDVVTDSSGNYSVPGLLGAFDVAPMPNLGSGEVANAHGAITSFDATFIAQFSVQMISPSALQQVAADVSGNGEVTSFDAAMVSQLSVQLLEHFSVAEDNGSDWAYFRCDNYVDEANQDCTNALYVHDPLTQAEVNPFYAVLYGDVTGNWPVLPPPGQQSTPTSQSVEASAAREDELRAVQLHADTSQRVVRQRERSSPATLTLEGWSGPMGVGEQRELLLRIADADGIEALDLKLPYDPVQISIVEVRAVGLGTELNMRTHDVGGVRNIGMYGVLPLKGSGLLLSITVEAHRELGSNMPVRVIGEANENLIPLRFVPRRPGVNRIPD